MEEWKPIEGFIGYEVSNFGRVRSISRVVITANGRKVHYPGVVMRTSYHYKGYERVMLRKEGKGKICFIHRLVALAFISNPLGLAEVNHKNEDKTDNKVANLEWSNHQDNCNYGTRNERSGKHRKNHPLKSKPVAKCTINGTIIQVYPSQQEAARQMHGSQGAIANALRKGSKSYGFIWKYA